MAKQSNDVLDALAAADPKEIIALILWKARHQNPEMSLQITEKDINGYRACVKYLEVTPEVRIARPQGRPAQEYIPARGRFKEVQARPAEPARPFVFVGLVEEGTENCIRPVENNEEDYGIAQKAEALRAARDKGPQLANQLISDMNNGTFSSATIQEAAQILITLAKA